MRNVRGKETGAGWQRFLEIALQADPERDEWRTTFRAALAHPGNEEELRKLAATAPLEKLSEHTLALLSAYLNQHGAVDRSIIVLRAGQHRFPSDYWINHRLAKTLLDKQQSSILDEAIGFLRVAIAIRPNPSVHTDLGSALYTKGRLDEAIAEFNEALHLNKNYAFAHYNLGLALKNKGDLAGSIDAWHRTVAIKPDFFQAHYNLGAVLLDKGQLDEAIVEFREALQIKEDYLPAYDGLGLALRDKGQLDEAIAAHNRAIALKPDNAAAYSNLSLALADKGRLDEAIAASQKAIELAPNFWLVYNNLSNALGRKGRLEEAIAASRKAIELKPDEPDSYRNLGAGLNALRRTDDAIAALQKAIDLGPNRYGAHYNLGVALEAKGRLDRAIEAYRKAIELKPDFAQAHCNLGKILQQNGQFDEALKELRRGHELGTRHPNWRFPSATWVQDVVVLKQLDERLPAVLEGKSRPKDAADCLAFAELCQGYKHYYYAAVRFYEEAFAKQPDLASDLKSGNRYFAASVAALAGCGQGKDADQMDDKERARLRRQAISWLRAELAAWQQLLGKAPDNMRAVVERKMERWQQDPDFAGVRGPETIGKLPEDERQDWQKLWQEVEALRKSAQKPLKKASG
jgi:tetratricopeptide (TPR) repeat protein